MCVRVRATEDYERYFVPRRSEFLQVLASVEAILVRATPTDDVTSTMLSNVILDTGIPEPTGMGRILAVEQCYCPAGYKGLSCEVSSA